MTPEEKVKQQFKQLGKRQAFVFPCTVISVDKENRTTEVKDTFDITYPDVRLKSAIKSGDDVIVYPAIDSTVLVVCIGDKENDLLVISYSEVEEIEGKIGDITFLANADGIELNGDDFGGLVKAPELKTQVDKNTAILDSMLQVFQVVINEPGMGSPSALQAALKAATDGKPTADLNNIENQNHKVNFQNEHHHK